MSKIEYEPAYCTECHSLIHGLTGGMYGGKLYCSCVCQNCRHRQYYRIVDGKRIEISSTQIKTNKG